MPEAFPGWYPDPAGVPGRYRYWDGSRWSRITTDDPHQPLPSAVESDETTGDAVEPDAASDAVEPDAATRVAGARRRPVIIAVLVVLLTVVAVGLGNLRQLVDRPLTTSATPTSGASQGRSASPTPATPIPLRCPKGNPTMRASHPIDGRVYGGNLSFEEQPTFERASVETRFHFAYDVLQQTLAVSQDPAWIAQLAVGQLRARDGFVDDPRNTVESLVRCVMTGNMYSPYLPTRTDIRSESLSIDGHPGWLIETEITVDRPDIPVAGDHTIFIVVRDGSNWGFFFGAVPIGNAQLDAVLARTIRGLHAT